jgi:hypothetical protein
MKVFFLFLILVIYGCNIHTFDSKYLEKSSNNCVTILDNSVKKNEVPKINKTSAMDFVDNNLKLWLNSWDSKLYTKNFKIDEFGYIDGIINYDSLELIPNFLELYRNMLVFSIDNSKCIDLYTYKIGIEKRDGIFRGYIDADTKVFIHNLLEKKSKLIISGGTTINIDDSVWLTDSCVIIVGSDCEFNSSKEIFCPFIMVYFINQNYFYKYCYKSTFIKLNEDFIKQKFPYILFE